MEAGRNQVLPMDDGLINRLSAFVAPAWPQAPAVTFLPGAGPVHDESVPALGNGFTIAASVVVPEGGAEGVLCALGDWNGGYALVVVAGRLIFVFARPGAPIRVMGDRAVPAGAHRLWARMAGGVISIGHDEEAVGSVEVSGVLPFALQHGGAGLRLGHDAGLPVSDDYTPPFPWTGELDRLEIETPSLWLRDAGAETRAALHAD